MTSIVHDRFPYVVDIDGLRFVFVSPKERIENKIKDRYFVFEDLYLINEREMFLLCTTKVLYSIDIHDRIREQQLIPMDCFCIVHSNESLVRVYLYLLVSYEEETREIDCDR